MTVEGARDLHGKIADRPARGGGFTFAELMVVVALVAVALLIAGLSVMRGRRAAADLACRDNMQAIRSALEVYYVKNHRTYPADQAEFEDFLRSPTYFAKTSQTAAEGEEPRCPLDRDHSYHYLYQRDPATGRITITCPVPDSGHGSLEDM